MESKDKLHDKLYDAYASVCPLDKEQELEVVNIRTAYEKELLETARWVQTEGKKQGKTTQEIEDKIEEYDDKLEIKYMEFEIKYFKTLSDE